MWKETQRKQQLSYQKASSHQKAAPCHAYHLWWSQLTFTLAGQRSSSVPHSLKEFCLPSLSMTRENPFQKVVHQWTVCGYQTVREMLSTHSSPYKTLERRPREDKRHPPPPFSPRECHSSSHWNPAIHLSHAERWGHSPVSNCCPEMSYERPFSPPPNLKKVAAWNPGLWVFLHLTSQHSVCCTTSLASNACHPDAGHSLRSQRVQKQNVSTSNSEACPT